VRFVEVIGGRVALALDNAGLFADLETVEAQLSAALGVLGEAVTIQNAHGSLIYANQAAARMLGFTSPQEALARPMEEIVGLYDYFREDGRPLDPAEFPGRGAAAGETRPPLLLRAVDRRSGEQRWRRMTSSAIRDPQGGLTMIVNVIADITEVKRAELAQTLLAQAGELLNLSLDLDRTLQQLAALCVPRLADWCTVRLPDERGHILRTVAVAHTDPRQVELVRRTREAYPVKLDASSGPGRVFLTGESLLVNEIAPEMLSASARSPQHLQLMQRLRPRAALLVPLHSPDGPVGVLTLVSADSARTFDASDVALASELGRRAAHAVANARIYAERSRMAHTLQESLLPETLPAVPGCRAASLYRPAGEGERVGGDFYELFALEPGAWMLVVGDVTGRGAAAAALTGFLRHTLRAIATSTGSAFAALEKVNRDLTERPVTAPCTAVVVVLRELDGEGRAEIICAGHPLPLLVRGGDAQYVGGFGPLLGVFPDARWTAVTVPLRPGDLLALYSDGVPDTRGARDRFGPARLQQTLAPATSAADAVARVQRALGDFHVGPESDDTALLVLERLAVRTAPDAPAAHATPLPG
jgi:PAS domain S-box-containing protein